MSRLPFCAISRELDDHLDREAALQREDERLVDAIVELASSHESALEIAQKTVESMKMSPEETRDFLCEVLAASYAARLSSVPDWATESQLDDFCTMEKAFADEARKKVLAEDEQNDR